jgi:cyanophycin synthetase
VRLIAHLFRNTGHHVGFTTTDGVYVQNRRVMEGDMTGSFSANIILSNRAIDVAVLETARGGLLRSGLGFDECDVGVVLNVSADHLSLGGINTLEQLADLKGVVAAVVKRTGHAVLNADDPLVYNMRTRTPGDVVLFSSQEMGENPLLETHTARGGISGCMRNGQFVIRRGRLQIAIADEREVPLTLGGAAHFQRQNILAAALTAYVSGIRYDDIRGGLLSFFPSPSLTPGRLNLIRLKSGARVLVDYAHNAAAITGLVDLVSKLPAHRRIAVVGVPGDRRDEDIREAGRLSARFDHVIVKEDVDRRGREPGEIAELLTQGLTSGGADATHIEFIPDELDAVRHALALLDEEDVLVIMAARVSPVLALLRQGAEVRP